MHLCTHYLAEKLHWTIQINANFEGWFCFGFLQCLTKCKFTFKCQLIQFFPASVVTSGINNKMWQCRVFPCWRKMNHTLLWIVPTFVFGPTNNWLEVPEGSLGGNASLRTKSGPHPCLYPRKLLCIDLVHLAQSHHQDFRSYLDMPGVDRGWPCGSKMLGRWAMPLSTDLVECLV